MIGITEPVMAARGLELVDVECRREPRGSMIRLLVDRDGGVDLDTISRVSREVSDLFDVESPVSGPYTLEVSSPGINRPLRTPEHFRRFVGKRVRVRIRPGATTRRKLEGRLEAAGPEGIRVADETGESFFVEYANIERANYEHEFTAADFGKSAKPRGGAS